MSRYVPVEGFSSLVRDTESNAIINVDHQEIEQARERKRLLRQKREQQQQLENKVNALENDISDIKNMLKQLLDANQKEPK